MTESPALWRPDWSLPPGVHAFVTGRVGGFSQEPWDSFNLGEHVGDAATAVAANRQLLLARLESISGSAIMAVQWARQVHGTTVLRASLPVRQPPPQADAIVCTSAGLAIGVLTADCLPVLFCADDGSEFAVAHAGWRGLLGGVLEATLQTFATPAANIRTWLGPAIGPCHFEVGDEVRTAFLQGAPALDASATAAAFAATANPGKWLADLYALARIRLAASGVINIAGTPVCTRCNDSRFYSYRSQAITGRFATLMLKSA